MRAEFLFFYDKRRLAISSVVGDAFLKRVFNASNNDCGGSHHHPGHAVRSGMIYNALLPNDRTVVHQGGPLDLSPSSKILVVLRIVFRVLQLVRYLLGLVLVYVALIVVDDLSLKDTPKVYHGS